MQQIRHTWVDGRQFPVLISDENEALLAADAAGGAIIGLWDPKAENWEAGPAKFLVESADDVDEQLLERVVRRRLALPWRICRTERLAIREICREDFVQIMEANVGFGLSGREELEAYARCQYSFYGFGIWAVTESMGGGLVGLCGVTVPQDEETDGEEWYWKMLSSDVRNNENEAVWLEMGYHIFPEYRRRGYAREACRAVMRYAALELGVSGLLLRINRDNLPSKKVAQGLGFERRRRAPQLVHR